MNPRVVIINDYGSITGGVTRVVVSSIKGLADLGYKVTFISSVGPIDKTIDQSRVRCINLGLEDLIHNSSRINAAYSGIWSFTSARELRRILKDFDKENTIIHLHSWVKALSSSIIDEIDKSGFKLVITLHDYFLPCPNGGFFNYPKSSKCSLDPLSVRCILENCDSRSYAHKIWRVARSFLQKNLAGLPDGVKYYITISDYSEKILLPFLGAKKKIFRVKNPIFVKKAEPTLVGKNNNFLFIGRLSPEKGGKLFADAANSAMVSAVFLGAGAEEADIRKINPSFQLLGWKSSSDIILALRNTRALIFPSLWHETQGLVISEAAAVGVPSIVSDQCAGREWVENGITGLLFKHGDVEDLAKQIRLLHENPELAEKMGASAYEKYWKEPQDELKHAKDLANCYKQIMEDS